MPKAILFGWHGHDNSSRAICKVKPPLEEA